MARQVVLEQHPQQRRIRSAIKLSHNSKHHGETGQSLNVQAENLVVSDAASGLFCGSRRRASQGGFEYPFLPIH